MGEHNNFAVAMAYVRRLAADGGFPVEKEGHRLYLTVEGADTRICCEFGEPKRDWWPGPGPERMELVRIKAPRATDARYGWGDVTRTFSVRQCGTLNGAGILKALGELRQLLVTATERRAANEKREQDRKDKRAAAVKGLQDAGLDVDDYFRVIFMGGKDHLYIEKDGSVTLKMHYEDAAEAVRALEGYGILR